MLLTELLKLFSSNLNINEERFITIIESNNIKLNQRLLCKSKESMKVIYNIISDPVNTISNESKNISDSSNSIYNINNSNNINSINNTNNNNLDANLKKKESSGRGRGRPKKTKEIIEEDSVLVEVVLITLENIEYYKTNENVVLNKQMEIEGILKDGKIVKYII